MLVEHGGVRLRLFKPPKILNKMSKIRNSLNAGKAVTLSRIEVRKLKFDTYLPQEIRDNLMFELATTQSINATLLTDRDLDVDILKKLSNNQKIKKQNHLLQKHLTCFVPFIGETSPEELLKIRQSEEDSFILFRKGLNQAIDEYKIQGDEITENDAKAIYGDIIEPKLSELDIKVKKAKRKLARETISSVAGWTGAISLGWFAGLLPNDLVNAAATLGLVKVVAEITRSTMVKSKTDEDIQEEPMYFLWKVKRASEK